MFWPVLQHSNWPMWPSADAKAVVNCWCCTFPLAGLGLALGHIGQLLCCKTGQNNAQVYPFSCCSCCSCCSPSFSWCFNGACCSDEEYNNNIYRGLVYGLGGTIATAIFGGQYNGTTIQSALDAPSGFLPLGGGYYINFPMKWGCAPLCWPPCRPCMGMSTPPAGMDGVSYCYANAALLPPSARNMRDQPLKAFGLWAWPKGTGRKHPQTGREDALPPLPTDPSGWGKWDRSELPKTFHGVQPQLDKLIINYHGIVVAPRRHSPAACSPQHQKRRLRHARRGRPGHWRGGACPGDWLRRLRARVPAAALDPVWREQGARGD